jgi:ubiquitin-conjugating enzyme E2 J2
LGFSPFSFLGFMIDTAPTLGSIESSKSQKQKFARQSLEYNARDANFAKLFPEYVELHKQRLADRQAALGIADAPDGASSMISHDTVGQLRGANDRAEIFGVFAAFAGIIAVFSIVFAMRFL